MLLDKFNRRLDVIEILAGAERPGDRHPSSSGKSGEGSSMFPSENILAFMRIMSVLGLKKALLTGGEPLLRPDIIELVGGLASIRPRMRITLRTGGAQLPDLARPLAVAGLNTLLVSIPALDPAHFPPGEGYGAESLDEAARGIELAKEVGIKVVVEVTNHPLVDRRAAVEVVLWAIANGYGARVVEGGSGDTSGDFIGWTFGQIQKVHNLEMDARPGTWKVAGTGLSVECVSARSLRNCRECGRLWLTFDGKIRLCCHHYEEHDLNDIFSYGQAQGELLDFAAKIPLNKPRGAFFNDPLSEKISV